MRHLFKKSISQLLNNYVLIGFVLIILFMVVFLINSSIKVQYSELEWSFLRSNVLDATVSSNHMIAKLENRYKLYDKQLKQEEVDVAEFLLRQGIKANFGVVQYRFLQVNRWLELINRKLINLIRLLTGEEPLPTTADARALSLVGVAFLLEFDNEFTKAVILYDEILMEKITDSRLYDLVRLHRGFCFAMLGNESVANYEYDMVMASQKASDIGMTAATLKQYLKDSKIAKQKVLASNADALSQALKIAQLGYCDETDSILNTITSTSAYVQGQKAMIRGQCYELRGNKREATKSYIKAVAQGDDIEVAKNANRRLLLISHQLPGEESEAIEKITKKINEQLQDSIFTSIASSSELHAAEDDKSAEGYVKALDLSEETAEAKVIKAEEEQVDSSWLAELQELHKEAEENIAQQILVEEEEVVIVEKAPPANIISELDPIAPLGKYVTLKTKDKVFSGVVVSEPGAMLIRLKTMIGVVAIPRDQLK
ncbi:MAG: hypothetical protein GX801_06910 [Fibrobacter sp.]|nr:hypothetical protein [Fibrobacter sp.]